MPYLNSRHAYCIIAHSEPKVLSKCIQLIDDPRNDIFVHIDLKSDIGEFRKITARYSRLVFIERINVNWGGLSLVHVELLLLETAQKYGKYSYYHLISGVDLPIKSQNYIHGFCEEHSGCEYIALCDGAENQKDLISRTERYFLFTEHYKVSSLVLRKMYSLVRRVFLALQQVLGMRRKFPMPRAKMSNWFSCSDDLCSYLVARKDYILNTYKYVHAPDEIALATEFINSPFRHKVFSETGFNSAMREIDWERGKPYVWQLCDFEKLKKSNAFFARKFSSEHIDIVNDVFAMVKAEC